MRIDRLDLIAYGPFTGKSLDLSEGAHGLHLVYGDNEAGKSTSLRALIALLFGIPIRTNDSHLHSNPQLRIGGKLRLSNGKFIEFVRRKGTKSTLLEPGTDSPLDDSMLSPFLPGGMDENIFTKLYGIDHAGLIAGGQELLNQAGDLGQALFSAAVGTAGLRNILADLQNNADGLFKPRASTKEINQSISAFKDAQKRIKESSLPVAEWKRLQKAFKDIQFDIEQVEKAITEKSKEKNHLDRLKRVKIPLAERRGVIARIKDLGDVLLLPEGFDENHKTAKDNLQKAIEAKEKASAKLSSLQQEKDGLNVREDLLANGEIIQDFHKDLGAVETAIKDRPQQDGKRRLLRNQAELILKGIRPDLTIESSDQLRPLTTNKKWISDLAKDHSLLEQKKENALSTLQDLENEQAGIKNTLEKQAPTNFDLSELKAAVSAARKEGDIEKRLSESIKRATDEHSACEDELLRLGRYSGTIEDLLKIAMPLSETLDRFDRIFDDLSDTLKEFRRKQKGFEDEKKQAEQDLQALLLTGDVPTMSELEKERFLRDHGWQLIKEKYIENRDVEKDIAALVQGSDLPAFYEKKVADADDVSDQLRLAADKVVKRADLEVRIETLKFRCQDLTESITKTNEEQNTCQKEWEIIWAPLGVKPGTPREMKQWILKIEKLVSHVQSTHVISRESENLAENCNTLKQSISQQILKFENTMDLSEMSLEAMLCLCEQKITEEEELLEQMRHLENSLRDLKNRINKVHEEQKTIEKAQATWAQDWNEAISGLGLKPDAHPEQTIAVFEQLLVYFDKLDKSEELKKRIYGIDQVSERFEKRVFEFTDKLGIEREGQTAAIIAAKLNRDLSEAREARISLRKINIQEKEVTEEIESATITIRTAQEQLAALRNQAGVEKDEDLEIAGENSRKMRELKKNLDAFEQELTRTGDGLGIQELEKEALESDVDTIENELEKISSELNGLQENRDKLRDQRQTLQNDIQTKDGSAKAATASEEAEQQLAAIVSGIEQYLRLQIASLILKQRIEDYRKKNQGPVLSRAGELFSKLTLGSYANLRDELDGNGRPILLGVRPNNSEVPVEGMSDGTRDQLYLSLRLATLEQHFSKGEPMPFIVDDILISFDDNRTEVCLEVLSDLASRTQVLLFTHHRRVQELAGKFEARAGVYKHELH